MKDIVYIVIGIVVGALLYKKFFTKTAKLPDTSVYEHRIDSLQKEIEMDKSKIAVYDSISNQQEEKIAKLKKRLNNTAAEAAQEEKEHEKDLNRIRAMSNNDIAATFAESFK